MNTKHSKWYYPSEKMPNIGDHIIVSDGYDEMAIVFTAPPTDVNKSNVIMWRYDE